MLNYSRDKNESARRRGGGEVPAICVTPDQSYESEGTGKGGRK